MQWLREFFFDDDTFTANLPRAREIAKKLAPLGLTWSCNSRANLDYDTIKSFKDSGLRLFLVGYESGNDDILTRIKKGVTMDEMRRFTKSCQKAGVVIHGTFILGLPIETQQSIENTRYQPQWNGRARMGSGEWTAMLVIPLAAMKLSAGSSQTWRINFVRGVIRTTHQMPVCG